MREIFFKSCLTCENYNTKYLVGADRVSSSAIDKCLLCRSYDMWQPKNIGSEFIKRTVSESTITTNEDNVNTAVSEGSVTIDKDGVDIKVSESTITTDSNGDITVSVKEVPVSSFNKDGLIKYIDFSEALKALKEGRAIAQKGQKKVTIILCRTSLKLPTSIIEAPFFLKVTSNSKLEVWKPSVEDILAEDWYIVK